MGKLADKQRGAVIYTRVSTEEQVQHGTSLDSQRDACRQKALALNLPIVAEYEDAGVSGGFLTSRRGMMGALADIRAGRADTLICTELDRMSRDVEDQQAIRRDVRAAGASLVFCHNEYADSPEGDMHYTMDGGFKAYEKAVIRRRTMRGQRQRAEQGRRPCSGWDPFGFHVVRKADVTRGEYPADMVGRHVVKPGEAEALAHMYRQYAAGAESLSGLAKWLYAQGIPTRRGKAFWDMNCVRIVLMNPLNKGVAAFGRTRSVTDRARLAQRHPRTGEALRRATVAVPNDPSAWITWEVPAIVPEDVWEEAQRRLAENRKAKGGNPRRVGMLAGRLLCPACGGPMTTANARTGADGRKVSGMACVRHHKRLAGAGEAGCDASCYRLDVIEAALVEAITDAARRGDLVREVIAAALAAYNAPAEADDSGGALARIEAQLSDLERRQAATVKAQIAGVVAGADPAAYSAVFADQRAGLQEKRAYLVKRAGPSRRWAAADFPRMLADAREVLTSPDVPGGVKRDAVRQLVERVYPLRDGARVIFAPGALGETVNFMLQ